MKKEVKMKDIAALLSDSDFIRLQKERSAFNTFNVLKLKHQEIRHSNVLAWLFKPQESHKFGSAFLEQFLLKLVSCADEKDTAKTDKICSALSLLAKGGMHVSVRREVQSEGKKRLDLQIECFFPSLEKETKEAGDELKKVGFVILIENKIYSTQGKNQLAGYLNSAEKDFGKNNPDIKIIPVYLTLDEDDKPSGERGKDYFHMTYGAVLEILESLTGASDSERYDDSAGRFIKDYIKTLKELLNMNTEEQEYAKKIYKDYRDTIDFICANGDNCITDAGNQFLEQYNNTDLKVENIEKGNSHFFPFTDSVLKDTKGGVDKDWRGGAACGYFFQLYAKTGDRTDGFKGTLALKIEVGPFEDSKKRQELLDTLESKGITYSKRKNEKPKYTRLSYEKLPGSEKINDVTNVDEVAAAMKKLFEKTKNMRKKLHEGIEEWKNQFYTNPDEEK